MVLTKTLAVLILITVLGIGLRLYRLTDFPPSLNWDEVSHAYNAYSVLTTGRDQWGQILPVFNFRAYGDYPTTLNLYLTVPAIKLWGPTDYAARLPGAVAGVLTTLAMFVAGYWWKKDWRVGLVAATLTAFEPWTMFTSRTVLQSNGAVLLLALGLAVFMRKKAIWPFGLALLAYHNTRIFVPLLALGMATKSKKWLVLAAAAIAILLTGQSRARSGWVGIINPGSVSYLEQARAQSKLPLILTRLIYNRPVYLVIESAKHYGDYFLPGFLFIHGGTQYQYSLPGYGVMHLINAPFFYYGLITSILGSPILIWWLLVAPVAAAITTDRFAVVRATTMIPVVYLFTAAGVVALTHKRRVLAWGMAILYLLSIGYFGYRYINQYPKLYSSSWQYGYKQAVEYIKSHYDQYDEIIFTKKYGEPHEFVFWYWPVPPRQLLAASYQWDYHDNWYWVDGFAKFRFVNDWEMADYVAKLPKGKNYLIIYGKEPGSSGDSLTQINFLDGQPAFLIKAVYAQAGN